jgi:cyclopropane-fatty-acyl-phospholipid synthase
MKNIARNLFERAVLAHWQGVPMRIRYWDGQEVTAGKGEPVVTLHFKQPSVLWEILRSPSLGFGHGFSDGTLEVEGDLQAFLRSAFAHPVSTAVARLLTVTAGRISPARAEANARFHYDTGNEFFKLWLDPSLTYSCAYFQTPETSLEQAQIDKRELICRKLELQKGQTLLDVGCGWGALLFHAMEKYGVNGVGITPAKEQAAHIRAEAKRRGLEDRLTLHVADWRTLEGSYDRVVSVGMFEHVGQKQYPLFFKKWQQWLKPGGVSLLHTIGAVSSEPNDPWIEENIFPGGYLPTLAELAGNSNAAGLIVADVENLWRHYALTLQAWYANFENVKEKITNMTSVEFYRTWQLYLRSSEAGFSAGRLMLYQLILTNGKRQNQPLTRNQYQVK